MKVSKRDDRNTNNTINEIKVSDITIGERHRKDMGDIEELAESIKETGLLQPIGVTPDRTLVFGERRLRAYRDLLKLETIPARIIEVESVLHGEFAENMMRKDFTVSERVAIVDALRSFSHGGDRRSKQKSNCDDEPLTVDEAAKRAGLGGKDGYSRAKAVIERGVPELIEAMDSGKSALSAAAKLAEAEEHEQQKCLAKLPNAEKLTAAAVKKQLRQIRNQTARDETLARAVEEVGRDDAIQIHHCRFQLLEQLAEIQPNSVPLICTDIPYGDDFVDQVNELAAFAERVLVDGGTFISYLGQHRLPEKLAMLQKHLTYQWMPAAMWQHDGTVVPRLKCVNKSIPIAIFSKGKWTPQTRWVDTYVSHAKEQDWHPWQRPYDEVERFVQYFTEPGDLVVDPCGGGFTTAVACLKNHRRFIGCDDDKAAVVRGQERLAEEQRPEVTQPIQQITINSVIEGDCRELIPALPDNSINLCFTSPPYANQRKGLYPGVPESEYPDFTVEWMSKLRDKLADDGSVLIVIRPHLKRGAIGDYVLRSRLALREAGWNECEKLIWLKVDGGGCMGSNKRPRRTYEEILWFSKTHDPFIDTKACGQWSENITLRGSTCSGDRNKLPMPIKRRQSGRIRVADVISVPIGAIANGVQHPAMFPIPLAERLIQTFCPQDGTVLDPFAGSGSTLIAAKQMGSLYYGFDIMPEYVELANNRLLDEFEQPVLPKAG